MNFIKKSSELFCTSNIYIYIYIWPEFHKMTLFEREFCQLYDFPGIIGAIDGFHIPISAPIESPKKNYINHKVFIQ